jgi:hypothetical protein
MLDLGKSSAEMGHLQVLNGGVGSGKSGMKYVILALMVKFQAV